MHDTEFMSAADKEKVLRQWKLFLKSGLRKDKFSRALYDHLILHCSFIAHFDIHGFYDTYFTRGNATARILGQFDDGDGLKLPEGIEIGGTHWYTDERYADINAAMCEAARPYLPQLMRDAYAGQRSADIEEARALLARHGIPLKI